MRSMILYYISRAAIALALGIFFGLFGMPWWGAILIGVATFGMFIWSARSGRYTVDPKHGVTPLRRDERARAINDKAGRNAFAITILSLAGLTIYYGLFANNDVPVNALNVVLAAGMLSYFITTLWLNRT